MLNFKRFSRLSRPLRLIKKSQLFSMSHYMNKEWLQQATKELRGKDHQEVLVKKTQEEIEIKPIYTHKDTTEGKKMLKFIIILLF